MISSSPCTRRSSSRVRWVRLMNIASSSARCIERSARSMGSRYMTACPSWNSTGALRADGRKRGSASPSRSESRRARAAIEAESTPPGSPARMKTRNLSLRTLVTATMSVGESGPPSAFSESSARAKARSSSS